MEEGDYEKNNWESYDQFREDSAEIHQSNWGIGDQLKEVSTEISNNSTVTFGEECGKDDDDDFAAESNINIYNNNNGNIRKHRNIVDYQNKKTHHHRSSGRREPKNFMKHTESSIRKTKSWNESVQDNDVKIFSDFRAKPGIIRVSRYAANHEKTQACRVERKYKGRIDHSSRKKQHDKRKTQQQQEDSDEGESNYPSSPMYYISRDGSVKTWESFTQKCGACEEDFCSPFVQTKEDVNQYYDYQEPYPLPNIAVLTCGHLFHCQCLDNVDQSGDPLCLLCLKEA